MIRTLVMVTFWGLSILIVGPFLLIHAFVTRSVELMYRIATRLGITGVKLAGVRVDTRGLDGLEPGRNYIFMSNHVSNLDPPVLVPSIPGRCSVLVKKEVFRVPVLGAGLKTVAMVPVDR